MKEQFSSKYPLPVVRPPSSLEVFLLGVVEFSAAVELMRHLELELKNSPQHRAVLLLCEHPPCFSRGTASLSFDEMGLVQAIGPIQTVSRAGGLIEHGPSQLAIYPVCSLDKLEVAPLGFRQALESLVARLCEEYGVPEVEVLPGQGIQARTGLIARTAMQIRDQISQFGIYLNASSVYRLEKDARNSSVETSALKRVELTGLKSGLISLFEQWFEQTTTSVFTRHPLLRRKS